MNLLPVALDVREKLCLVVGGGPVAARKTKSLLECGARVHVVSPQLCDAFEALRPEIELFGCTFLPAHCDGCFLVFACTNSREVNAEIANAARAVNALCSIADDAEAGDFYGMATVRRGDICVAVSTQGGSPALAKHLRLKIEESIGPEYSRILEILSTRRSDVKNRVHTQKTRATLWNAILDSDVLSLLREGRDAEAEAIINDLLK
ncbi:MAG TPA: bifunctional precorrin-2 dehydrogenase/sirohydrochlorin ferrochelatase [Abditibacteriaceae bacterium]|jgi:precorrin-2 dehydrogenase/sirohydrochlorin ferrochelatase